MIDASGEGAEVQHLTALSVGANLSLCERLNLLLWDEAVHLEGLPTVGTAELWVGARLWGQQSHLSAPQSTGHP